MKGFVRRVALVAALICAGVLLACTVSATIRWNMALVVSYGLLFIWSYWSIIGFFGLFRPKHPRYWGAQKRFLILVPAHNESEVIGELIDSVLAMDYPRELVELCVIADNCSDNTAQIVRERGCLALEHTYLPGEPKGKPYAIAYAIDAYDLDRFDAVVVFDADNLVTANYLQAMNNHLCVGHKLIQAYLDTKNPTDNWISAAYATSYYYMNRSWQLARERLGLGAAIGGTGFCVDARLLKKVGWSARSLTEDLEFQMQCMLVGVRAHWCHQARVFDEKPLALKASMVQRLRWARGHWQVCSKYFLPLMWRAVKQLDIRAFDAALYLVNPGKSVLAAITGCLAAMQGVSQVTGNRLHLWPTLVPASVWVALLLIQFAYMAWAIWQDSRPNFTRKLGGLLALWPFNVLYYPLFVWALLTMGNTDWNPTKHTRAIKATDVA